MIRLIRISESLAQSVIISTPEKLQEIHIQNLQYQFIDIKPEVSFQSIKISNLDNQTIKISNACSVTSEEYPIYAGEYEATPKKESQIMPTAGKVLLNDFTVKGIPVTRVTNPSGGITVIIGG